MELIEYFETLKTEERGQLIRFMAKPGVVVMDEMIPQKTGANAYLYLLDLTQYDDLLYTYVIILENPEIHFKRFTTYLDALKGFNHIKKELN
jgi:hypothetical protein